MFQEQKGGQCSWSMVWEDGMVRMIMEVGKSALNRALYTLSRSLYFIVNVMEKHSEAVSRW